MRLKLGAIRATLVRSSLPAFVRMSLAPPHRPRRKWVVRRPRALLAAENGGSPATFCEGSAIEDYVVTSASTAPRSISLRRRSRPNGSSSSASTSTTGQTATQTTTKSNRRTVAATINLGRPRNGTLNRILDAIDAGLADGDRFQTTTPPRTAPLGRRSRSTRRRRPKPSAKTSSGSG